jgi:uncharacterized membrane protein
LDIWVGLLILLALATPVAAVVALALTLTARRRADLLERRVTLLEREISTLAAAPPPQPQPQPAAMSAAEPVVEVARAAPPPPPPPRPSARSVPPISAVPPTKPSRSIEELVGARWSVIVGGVALALGGIFLVRYSIEQGWLGPAARLVLGALFAAALIVFGDRGRRAEARRGAPRRPIDIPAVLTSAGATSAFATVYAAYALYGFISPVAAFPLLGIVAVATLLAAALHGPMLGALGILAAYAVPLLVSSDEPNVWALLIYLLAPTAAAFAVARLRGWTWLALTAGLAAFFWGALATGLGDGTSGALLFYAAALTLLTAAWHSGLDWRPSPPARPDAVAYVLIGLYGLIGAAAPALDGFGPGALLGTGLLLTLDLALAALFCGLAPVAAVSGLLAALVAISFDDQALRLIAETTSLPGPGEAPARTEGLSLFLSFATVMAMVHLFGGAAAARARSASPHWWTGLLAASAAATPLLLLAAAYWRISALAPNLRFAGLSVLLAAVLAWLTDHFARRERSGAANPSATAAFATGAVSALGLAMAMAMREGALTVALAFLAAALGFVAVARPIRALGVLALVAAGIVLIRVGLDPMIVGDRLGTTPVFNALLWGYGAPAVSFWIGSRLFARAGQQWPSQALEGLALLFAMLLGFTEARHFAHGGDLAGDGVRLVEAGLDAVVAFGLAAAAGRLNLRRASPALGWGALAAGGVGLLVALLALAFGANPLFTGEPVGDGLVLNDLMVGYLAPAVAALLAARFAGEGRPAWVRRALGFAALGLGLAWASLTVRRVFAGPLLDGPLTGDGEWYAYSAVWLASGLALLAVGLLRRSQPLRLASAAVIVAVVLKVFLFDMAGLGGVWRALSFIGLGGVLVGIGAAYQRLLTTRSSP